jgi:hypothetical protein
VYSSSGSPSELSVSNSLSRALCLAVSHSSCRPLAFFLLSRLLLGFFLAGGPLLQGLPRGPFSFSPGSSSGT